MEVIKAIEILMITIVVSDALIHTQLLPPVREHSNFKQFKPSQRDLYASRVLRNNDRVINQSDWTPMNDPNKYNNDIISNNAEDRIVFHDENESRKHDSLKRYHLPLLINPHQIIPAKIIPHYETKSIITPTSVHVQRTNTDETNNRYLKPNRFTQDQISALNIRNAKFSNTQENLQISVEEKLANMLKEFEGNLSKILDTAVAKANASLEERNVKSGKLLQNEHGALYHNISGIRQSAGVIYPLPQPIQSNPSISGPPSFALIGRRAPPLADTGYISPPILNLNSNGHGNGTFDYSSEDGYAGRGPPEAADRGARNPHRSFVTPAQSRLPDSTSPLKVFINKRFLDDNLKRENNNLNNPISTNFTDVLKRLAKKDVANESINGQYDSKQLIEGELKTRKDGEVPNAGDRNKIVKSKRNLELEDVDKTVAETIVRDNRVAKAIPVRHTSIDLKGLKSFNPGYNSLDHSPPDPYVALLLSHYGRYLPAGNVLTSQYRNLYSYLAANNIHNNKPFGAYKIYEDADG